MVDLADRSTVLVSRSKSLSRDLLTFKCPPDKSFTHRAIIFASLAEGQSVIHSPLLGEDCLSTIGIMRSLGTKIEISESGDLCHVESKGVKTWQGILEADFGNSGTTARLLIGLFAGIDGLTVHCQGDDSLSQRPMKRVTHLLKQAGAEFTGPSNGDYLPLTVVGKNLSGGTFVYEKASAQVKSSVLMAGFCSANSFSIELPAGSRNHTEKFLEQQGANFQSVQNQSKETVTITGPFVAKAQEFLVPGDPSSAAFILSAAYLSGLTSLRIESVMLNPTRSGFFETLKKIGFVFEERACPDAKGIEERVDYVWNQKSIKLRPVHVSPSEIPAMVDEIPILAVLLSFVEGESRIDGLSELRVKESDRLKLTHELIVQSGGSSEIVGDSLIIRGASRQAKPFHFNSFGDHRMSMSAICMALTATASCQVEGIECIKVSFPNFFEIMESMTENIVFEGQS